MVQYTKIIEKKQKKNMTMVVKKKLLNIIEAIKMP